MNAPGPLLVALDGSELAERALPIAAELARRAGAELELVHVHVPITADPIHVEGLPVVDEHLRSLRRDHERAYLEMARERLGPGVTSSAVLLDGPAAAALAGRARERGAWLVVMTTHGRGGFERAWLGSVADALVRESPVPLLLVRPEPGSGAPAFERILVALDGSEASDSILDHAARVAQLAGAEIVLLRVVQSPAAATWVPGALPAGALDEGVARRQERGARDHLDEAALRLQAHGLRARTRVDKADAVAPAILDAARAERAGLVALATHGRSGLARLTLGSVADKVLRASTTPLLLFRPPDA